MSPKRGLLAALLLTLPAAGATLAPPRPLSPAEREAVRLAAAYLDRGPDAIREALSSSSPLARLTLAEANAEIEARAGGRSDVTWELRTPDPKAGPEIAVFSVESPSGLDDTLVFRMVDEGGPRVLWVKSFHEAWVEGRSLAVREEAQPSGFTPGALAAIAAAAGLLAAFLLLAGVSFLPEKPLPAAVLGLLGAGLAAGLAALLSGRLPVPHFTRRAPELFAPMRRATDVARVGRLLALRRGLEAGEPKEKADCLALARKNPEPMAQLWVAQRLMAVAALPEAKRVLAGIAHPEEVPWEAVVRARIAFLEKRDTDALAAYSSAASRGVPHDGVLLEALAVAGALGFDRPDLDQQAALKALGPRSSEARVVVAAGLAQDKHPDEAEAALLSAWREQPLDRETLLSTDELEELLHRPAVVKLLSLASAEEPTVGSDEAGRHAAAFPAAAALRLCGRRLRVLVGGAELLVPAGAELAPAGTPAEDAGAERRALVERALAQVPRLAAEPPPAGAFVQPALRREILRAAFALARRNRWNDIVALTARVKGSDDQVPSEILLLRAQALRRGGHPDEAKALLKELGASAAFLKRNDPVALYELGEMFVSLEEFDAGIRFMQKAAARLRPDAIQERIVQVRTEQKLATRFTAFASPHFEVRFPPERQDLFGQEAARVLEAERVRLSKWLNPRPELKTTVQILWFEEFRRTYGAGGDVLGLYDGKIRVPLAGVGRFVPFVVSIVTHELAHALIADFTKDNAPHWFQEGFAQHLEMRRFRPNYIMQYQEQGALLSLPMVEAVLARFPDPYWVEQAYQESEWAVAYIDAKWGAKGLERLMTAYRDGLFGDGALQSALGVDSETLSRDFVAWSLKQPKMLHDEIVAYDDTPDEGFHWSRDPKEPLGRTKPAEIPESLQ